MRATRMFAALSAVALIGVACGDDTTGIPAGLEVYTASLRGANERPTPVTTTATGTAIVTILGTLVSWKVDVVDIDSLTQGHIHRHATDTAFGGVVINFAPAVRGQNFTGNATTGSFTPVDSILTIIRAGRAYVNLHTATNGGGEIRGDLVKQ
jgi:CHRD domain-containing protein